MTSTTPRVSLHNHPTYPHLHPKITPIPHPPWLYSCLTYTKIVAHHSILCWLAGSWSQFFPFSVPFMFWSWLFDFEFSKMSDNAFLPTLPCSTSFLDHQTSWTHCTCWCIAACHRLWPAVFSVWKRQASQINSHSLQALFCKSSRPFSFFLSFRWRCLCIWWWWGSTWWSLVGLIGNCCLAVCWLHAFPLALVSLRTDLDPRASGSFICWFTSVCVIDSTVCRCQPNRATPSGYATLCCMATFFFLIIFFIIFCYLSVIVELKTLNHNLVPIQTLFHMRQSDVELFLNPPQPTSTAATLPPELLVRHSSLVSHHATLLAAAASAPCSSDVQLSNANGGCHFYSPHTTASQPLTDDANQDPTTHRAIQKVILYILVFLTQWFPVLLFTIDLLILRDPTEVPIAFYVLVAYFGNSGGWLNALAYEFNESWRWEPYSSHSHAHDGIIVPQQTLKS